MNKTNTVSDYTTGQESIFCPLPPFIVFSFIFNMQYFGFVLCLMRFSLQTNVAIQVTYTCVKKNGECSGFLRNVYF